MPKFHVRAVDRAGVRVDTVVESDAASSIPHTVTARGWTFLSVKPATTHRWRQFRLRRYSNGIGIVLVRQLGELLKAGVPLATAVEEVQGIAPNGLLSRAWQQVHREVAQGESFVNAVAHSPGLFATRHIAVLSLGQSQSNLANALLDISVELNWRSDVLRRWKQACTYPLFAIVLLALVCTFLILQVVPGLQPLLQASGEELPWMTQKILSFSASIHQSERQDPTTMSLAERSFITLSGLVLALLILVKSTSCRNRIASYCLRTRFFRSWVWPFSVAAHARCVHLMLKQNMPLTDAVAHAAPAASIWGTGRVWHQVAVRVEQEGLFANAVQLASPVPNLYTALIRLGESYGTLEASLAMSSRVFHDQATNKLQRLDGLIGPVLLLFVGLLMACVVMWILLPVYTVIAVQGGTL